MLRMVREVNSPHLQVCLDAPLMPDKSAVAMSEAARAVGTKQVMSHFGGEFDRNPDGSITPHDPIHFVFPTMKSTTRVWSATASG